jgi:hypothetical protein
LEAAKLIANTASTLERLTVERGVSHEALPGHSEMLKLTYLRVNQGISRYVTRTQHLHVFVRNCRNLLYFKCSDMGGTDDGLYALAQCCSSLVSLHYGHAAADSTAGLEAVLLACQDLHTVDLMEDDTFTLAHNALVIQHCRKLKALKITIHDGGMQDDIIPVLQPRLSELRHLCLEDFSYPLSDSL